MSGEVFAICEAENGAPAWVIACHGSAEQAYRQLLGNAMALNVDLEPGDSAAETRAALAWLAEKIDRDVDVRWVSLQRGVADSDLQFFRDYWAGQFCSLEAYPAHVEKPSTTSDAGLRALMSKAPT